MASREEIREGLELVGLSIIGLFTGYFFFLLLLKISGDYDYWKRYADSKNVKRSK